MMRSLRRVATPLGLLVASTCFALLLAEGFVRVFFPHSRDHVLPEGLIRTDPLLGWELVPGSEATHTTRYFDTVYRVNALGFRDEQREITKEPGKFRVLLYGDSQIFGWGVPAAERFSNRLEKRHANLELWNLAVPGYGLDQQILSYERGGGSWNADAVAFFVSWKTIDRTRYGYLFKKHKPRFDLAAEGSLRLIPARKAGLRQYELVQRLLRGTYLPHFVEVRLNNLKRSDPAPTAERKRSVRPDPGSAKPPSTRPDPIANTDESALPELTKRLLIRARDLARQRGHRLLILSELGGPQAAALEQLCLREGIGLLSVVFRGDAAEIFHGPGDSHWNPARHRALAQELACRITPSSDKAPVAGDGCEAKDANPASTFQSGARRS
jgi:hypothetical protein